MISQIFSLNLVLLAAGLSEVCNDHIAPNSIHRIYTSIILRYNIYVCGCVCSYIYDYEYSCVDVYVCVWNLRKFAVCRLALFRPSSLSVVAANDQVELWPAYDARRGIYKPSTVGLFNFRGTTSAQYNCAGSRVDI